MSGFKLLYVLYCTPLFLFFSVLNSRASTMLDDQMCGRLITTDNLAKDEAPARVTESTFVDGNEDGGHCHLRGYISSQIGFEALLPAKNWNHRMIEFGCGGYCGTTNDVEACPLADGYACISSDTGHRGAVLDALWANENSRAKMDWGYLASHLVAVFGKALIEGFYGSPPTKAYFLGMSNGGRQALIEAQRFPWDFDGIVSRAPPIDISQTLLTFAWGYQVVRDKDGQLLLGDAELKLLTASALRKCDLDDGVIDGIVSDPLGCDFNPSELLCASDSQHNCLSAKQVASAAKIYRGPTTSSGIPLTLGGPPPGSEFPGKDGEWSGWKIAYLRQADMPGFGQFAAEGICYLFLRSCTGEWKIGNFDFDRDYKRLRAMEPLYDASNPDLRRFRDAGGKLIIVQGTNDEAVSMREVIDYYQTVERTMGGQAGTRNFARLFLLPGVSHGRGSGADQVDLLGPIVKWVENGSPPEKLIAARVKDSFVSKSEREATMSFFFFPTDPTWIEFTRPVYPYPVRTRYKGHGDTTNEENFGPLKTSHELEPRIRRSPRS